MRSSASLQSSIVRGPHPQGAPVLGAGRRRLLDLGQVGEAVAELVEVVDRLALAGDDGLQLVERVALGEELLGQGALGEARLAGDVDLAAQRRPVEEQGDLRVGLDLLAPCASTGPR